ncbi:MAG: hypothetical protein IPG95_08165 [Saprospiraceae bacterium]|nr:hypothetical protein [Saprospiraceae bacterium]
MNEFLKQKSFQTIPYGLFGKLKSIKGVLGLHFRYPHKRVGEPELRTGWKPVPTELWG